MRNRLQSHALGALLVTLLLWGAVPPEAPVADAAMRGDLAGVEKLVREGADLNAAQGDGMTALHWAADGGHVEMAKLLIDAGATVSVTTRLGAYTPLHIAARRGHAEVMGVLLGAGADPSAATTTGGATPLHFAAATASNEAVDLLIRHGADVNAREIQWGQTPLMFAASSGRLPTVETLLAAGADVSATSKVVDMVAAAAEDRAAGQAREEAFEEFRGDRVAGGEGWLPSPEEVQEAIRRAREVSDAAVDESRATLRTAFAAPQEQVDNPTPDPADADDEKPAAPAEEEAADEYDSSYPALVGGQGGLTPLLHAVREGHTEVALRLVEAGADINQVSEGDQTSPLLMAALNGHFDMMFELLERGADPNVPSHAGTTPLFAVINTQWAPKARYPQQRAYLQQEATHHDVMEALLAAGADPNARLTKHLWFMEYTFSHLGIDMRGATAFWRAAHALDVPAMQILVAAGADPSIPTMKPPERRRRGGDDDGEVDPSGLPPIEPGGPGVYPIHAATGHGYGTGYAGNSHTHAPDAWMPAVRYLVEEAGADVNARDHEGYSPLHNAAARGDMPMIRYLVEHGADPLAVSRRGQTTVDMANGPVQRIQPFPEAMAYLMGLGAKNNDNCYSC